MADQAAYDEQPEEDRQQAPPAVGDSSRHGDGDPDGRQHGYRSRFPQPRRPLWPGSRGRGCNRRLGPGQGAGQISQEILQLAPRPGGQGPPRSVVELRGRQPARLEMITQLGKDRIASASEALISALGEFPDVAFITLPSFRLVPLCLVSR